MKQENIYANGLSEETNNKITILLKKIQEEKYLSKETKQTLLLYFSEEKIKDLEIILCSTNSKWKDYIWLSTQ